jgi:hypothetical protein
MALSTELNAPLGPVVIGGLIRSTLCDASVLTACVRGKAEPRAGPKSSRRGKGDMIPDKVRSRLRTIARQRGGRIILFPIVAAVARAASGLSGRLHDNERLNQCPREQAIPPAA